MANEKLVALHDARPLDIQLSAKHYGLDEVSPAVMDAIEAKRPTEGQLKTLKYWLRKLGISKVPVHQRSGSGYLFPDNYQRANP